VNVTANKAANVGMEQVRVLSHDDKIKTPVTMRFKLGYRAMRSTASGLRTPYALNLITDN
jgi:hypothetical protein